MKKILFVVSALFLTSTTPSANINVITESSEKEIDSVYFETKVKLYQVSSLYKDVLDMEEENKRLYEEVTALQTEIIEELKYE